MLTHEDKVTELEGIRFPRPMRGSCTTKRVEYAARRADRETWDDLNNNPRYYYVRVYIKGKKQRVQCTTDQAVACRFADMLLVHLQQFSKRKRIHLDLNYNLEQVQADVRAVPQAVELCEKIVADFGLTKLAASWSERVAELEKRIDALEAKILALHA